MQIKTTQELENFEKYLDDSGFNIRTHMGFGVNGIQVQYQKQWMAIVWNKNKKSYTIDSRLNKIFCEWKSVL